MDKKTKNILISYAVLVAVIMILLAVLIFRGPTVITVDSGNEKILQDSLLLMQRQVDSSHVRQEKIEHNYDSLLTVDPPVQYRSYEKIKFIYSTATPNQLDSVIRATWKTDLGHK